ncbi:MAG: MaoC/PaaZ C-terminal domain-containing protein [Gemmatimonadaceae bacterium]
MTAIRPGDRFMLDCHVDRRIFETFRDVFQDRNPLHTDAAFAASKGFPGVVMHGNILGGFLSRLVGEQLPVKNVMIQSETIDFRRPVYLDDHLQLEAVVVGVHDSVGAFELSFKFTNASGVKVASGTVLVGLLP